MRALAYGTLATFRRRKQIVLPTLTTASGAALLTIVLSSFPAIRHQAARFGDPSALARATVAVSVLVVLVGAVEVAICAARSINQRRREIGVLSANGVYPRSVVVALLVEPTASSVVGGVVGALVGALAVALWHFGGSLHSAPLWLLVRSGAIAAGIGVVAALLASFVPVLRAVRQPPLVSLNSPI